MKFRVFSEEKKKTSSNIHSLQDPIINPAAGSTLNYIMAGWPGILSLSWATTKLVSVIPNLESRGETSTRATARTSDEPRSLSFSTTWFTILKGDFFPASFAPLAVSGAHLHGR